MAWDYKDPGYKILDEDKIVNLVLDEDDLRDEEEGAADESDEEERGPSVINFINNVAIHSNKK